MIGNWELTNREQPPSLDEAKKRMEDIKTAADSVIRILTAEQALKAQRVIREAGRDEYRRPK